MIVKRQVNALADTKYHIERWSFDHLMDDSTIFNPGPTDTFISGLSYLNGLTVQIVADGIVLPERTVNAGQILLTASEVGYTNVEVGLNFPVQITGMPPLTFCGMDSSRVTKCCAHLVVINRTLAPFAIKDESKRGVRIDATDPDAPTRMFFPDRGCGCSSSRSCSSSSSHGAADEEGVLTWC